MRTKPCPRCGGPVTTWKAAPIFRGFMAGCRPCYDNDVEQWRVAGAVPVVFAPTARMALEKWNSPAPPGGESEGGKR